MILQVNNNCYKPPINLTQARKNYKIKTWRGNKERVPYNKN